MRFQQGQIVRYVGKSGQHVHPSLNRHGVEPGDHLWVVGRQNDCQFYGNSLYMMGISGFAYPDDQFEPTPWGGRIRTGLIGAATFAAAFLAHTFLTPIAKKGSIPMHAETFRALLDTPQGFVLTWTITGIVVLWGGAAGLKAAKQSILGLLDIGDRRRTVRHAQEDRQRHLASKAAEAEERRIKQLVDNIWRAETRMETRTQDRPAPAAELPPEQWNIGDIVEAKENYTDSIKAGHRYTIVAIDTDRTLKVPEYSGWVKQDRFLFVRKGEARA